MNPRNLLFTFFIFLALVLSIHAMQNVQQEEQENVEIEAIDGMVDEDDIDSKITSDRSRTTDEGGRFLLQKKQRRRMKCNKFPRICHVKGTPGSDCCKKKCVNVLMDRMNCGRCGKKCKYNEVCCNGKCVNPDFNRNHCGGCNNKCKNGGICVFGLCDYA